jgi:hypothetical protein
VGITGATTIAGGATINAGAIINGGCQLKGGNGDTGTGGIVFHNTVNMKRKDGSHTHFDWIDGKNYIRGDTIIDGNITINGGYINWKHNFDDGYSQIYTDNHRNGSIVFFNTTGGHNYARLDGGGFWLSNNGVRLDGCDRRIKENIVLADTNSLLDKINSLPIQNYNFIDNNFYEGKTVYGLIAQEVKQVFPEAVEIGSQHIPNINKIAEHKLEEEFVLIQVENSTKVDDNVQLMINNKPTIVKVIKSDETTITVAKWNEYKEDCNVLVYGTEIDDFHGLNQVYMSSLSIGGIQELSKQVDKLKSENNDLRIRLEKLETLLQVKP